MSDDGAKAIARARSLIAVDRHDEALDALGPALAEQRAEAHCLRGQCLLALRRPADAEEAARHAITLDPAEEWPHRILAVAHLRRGRARRARRAAEACVRLAPEQVEAHHVLSVAWLASRVPKRALDAARRAVEVDPHSRLAHLTAARALEANAEPTKAEHHYREALRIEPGDAEVMTALGDLLRRRGRRDEAAEVLVAAGRADPTDARVTRTLGRLGTTSFFPARSRAARFVLRVLAIQIVFRIAIPPDGEHVRSGVVLGVGLLGAILAGLAGAVGFAQRRWGSRSLPAEVRAGLARNHRSAALRWAGVAAFWLLVCGVWAAVVPTGRGGGAPSAAILFAASLGVHLVGLRLRRASWRAVGDGMTAPLHRALAGLRRA